MKMKKGIALLLSLTMMLQMLVGIAGALVYPSTVVSEGFDTATDPYVLVKFREATTGDSGADFTGMNIFCLDLYSCNADICAFEFCAQYDTTKVTLANKNNGNPVTGGTAWYASGEVLPTEAAVAYDQEYGAGTMEVGKPIKIAEEGVGPFSFLCKFPSPLFESEEDNEFYFAFAEQLDPTRLEAGWYTDDCKNIRVGDQMFVASIYFRCLDGVECSDIKSDFLRYMSLQQLKYLPEEADKTLERPNRVGTGEGAIDHAVFEGFPGDQELVTKTDVTVTAPAYGAVPSTSVTSGDATKYTGTVSWSPNSESFDYDTYTATVTLTPQTGYAFDAETTGMINGQTATAVKNPDGTMTLTHTFAALVNLDAVAVDAAKNAVDGASYASVAMATANTADALKSYVEEIATTAVDNSDVTVAAAQTGFTAAVAGDANDPDGTDGSYKFTITVSKGAQSRTTEEKTVTITTSSYAGLSNADAVAAAKTAVVDGSVKVAAGANQEAKTSAVQTYVNGKLTGDAEGVTAEVSFVSDDTYRVALSKGMASDTKDVTMTIIQVVSSVEVSVTAPAKGVVPSSTVTSNDPIRYAGIAAWNPNPATFDFNQAYKTTVTVTPKANVEFADAVTATMNGNVLDGTNVVLDNGTLTLTYTFDALTDPDIAIVATAKTAAEDATYTATAANTANALKSYVEEIAAAAVNNSDVTVTATQSAFTAAVAGDADDPDGTNGSYKFTITVSKGAQSQTTVEKTVAIAAAGYEGISNADAVAAAKTAVVDGSVNVAFGAVQTAKTSAVQAYVNGKLTGDAEGVTAEVSYVSGDTYHVALSKGAQSDSKDITMTVNVAADPDIAIVAAAKTAAEGATYTATMTNTANELKSYVEGIATTAVNNSNVTVTVAQTGFTAAVAGDADDPDGTDGSYKFTITVSKGAQSQTTEEKTVIITAIPATRISAVSATVIAPVSNAIPSDSVAGDDDSKYTVSGVTWSPAVEKFAFNTIYTVRVTATPEDGYAFSETVSAKINSKNGTAVLNADGTLTISYQFAATAKHSYATVWSMDENNHWHDCTDASFTDLKEGEAAHVFVKDAQGNDLQCVCGYRKAGERLVVNDVLTVPDTLNAIYDTPAELESKMIEQVKTKMPNIADTQVITMESTLQVNQGGTWTDATATDFPDGGKLSILVSYPDGINAANYKDYQFVVAHMFTTNAFGKTPGDVEYPDFTATRDGLVVTVTGLSPIAVGYKQVQKPRSTSGYIPAAPVVTVDSAPTGDNFQLWVWTMLIVMSFAGVYAMNVSMKKSGKRRFDD